MKIRPAGAADLPAIAGLVSAAYAKYIPRIGKPPGPMLDDYAVHVRNHAAWVAEIGGAIGGLLVLLPQPDHLLLDNVAVDPARQGQGIGRALMEFVDQEAARRGYGAVRLYTHAAMVENIGLYAALGWEETGRGEQDGYHRVFFRKKV